ncbi:MAG: COX15/CtaA family protein [Planctomycetaceae bacterium]
MNVSSASRWLHRFAWLTATLTLLLPVTTGAVVTTLKAGMAFSDWPSSDGYNMLAYPWLSSARDQFIEHGHRLSGLTIGLLSIALAVATWLIETRRPARLLALAIFASVFVQGMLGGVRVLMDEQTMALIHGDFAAGVFSLMCVFVVVTGTGWESRKPVSNAAAGRIARSVAIAVLVAVAIQYVLGGVLRHLGQSWAWMSHPWFALVPLGLAPLFAVTARRSGSPQLIRGANMLLVLIVCQALLGLGSWYVKFGVPAWGVVAQLNSAPQIVICSLHKVVGMLTLMTSVVNLFYANAVQAPWVDTVTARGRELEGSMMGVAT